MSETEKINWVTCPDCGSKIGIVISIGKASTSHKSSSIDHKSLEIYVPSSIREKLIAEGLDLELVDIEEGEEIISVIPQKFLGDLWGPINEKVRKLGGIWIRDGRNSRWELVQKEEI